MTAAVAGCRAHLVVLVTGLAVQKLDAGEGEEGEFEQGFAARSEWRRLPRMPVCVSENNTLSQTLESAKGCSAMRTYAWQGRRSTSKMEGVMRKVKEEDSGRWVSVPAAAQAAAVSSVHFTGREMASRMHAMLARERHIHMSTDRDT